MSFQVSPGVNFSETDLTAGAQQVSVSDAAFAGPFLWGPALEVHNIGSEDELVSTFGKPDDTTAPFWFSAASFLAYSDLLHVVRAITAASLNSTGAAKTLTGNVLANGAFFSAIAGNAFNSNSVVVGQVVTVNSVSYTVTSIANAHSIGVTPTPDANVVSNAISAYGVQIKNQNDYDTNFASGLTGYGPWAGKWVGHLGNALKVSVCSSANAFASSPSGTITLTAGSNVAVGSAGSAFNTELQVGDYLVANGQALQISSITNSTQVLLSTQSTQSAAFINTTWQRKWEFNKLFDTAPGTSPYASKRLGANDEMHIVVVDNTGKFTGTAGTVLERFAFVSKGSDAKNVNGENNYYVTVINRQSAYLWWLTTPGTSVTNFGSSVISTTFGTDALPSVTTMAGGQSDNANVGDSSLEQAYDLFKNSDQVDISLVITGPASAVLASYIIQNVCEARLDCVAFVSPTKASVVNNVGSEVSAITSFRNSLPSSSYAFLDSGWKYMNDKYNDVYRWVPLNGDMAGIAARSDTVADPWFSPAGVNRGNVKNVAKLAWNPKQLDRDELYKIGVNPVVQYPAQGTVLWGDKTLLSRPSAFDRINVRRLFIILEKTISRLARTQLFEFNDEFTRSQFRNTVEPYLRDVKSRRGVVDYRVICDDSNNTDAVIQQNRFVGDIYVKPARSINFVQLNFVAVQSGVSFQEVTGGAQ
jgi:hypothetical protein